VLRLPTYGFALAVACSLTLSSASEPAKTPTSDTPTPRQRADEHEDKAREAARANRLDEAAAELERAWTIAPSESIACNLGRIQLARKRMPAAAQFLTRCIERAPPTRTDEEKTRYTHTLKMLAEARAEALALDIQASEPDADVLVDGAEVGTSPLHRVIFVEPGARRVVATRDGFKPAEAEVTGDKGDVIAVVLTLDPLPPRPGPAKAAPPPPLAPFRAADTSKATDASVRPSGKTLATRLFAGGGGVTAVAAIVFFAMAAAASDEEQDTSIAHQQRFGVCSPQGCGAPESHAEHETMMTLGVGNVVATGVLVAAASGVHLWPDIPKARASGQRRLVTVATW
jgi:hypothetical protein